jgi:hypothetical protein
MVARVNEKSNDLIIERCSADMEPLDVWIERWTSSDDTMAVMNHIIFAFEFFKRCTQNVREFSRFQIAYFN